MFFLEIYEVESWYIILFVIVVIAVLAFLIGSINSLKQQIIKSNLTTVAKDGLLREKDLVIQGMTIEIKGKAQDMAIIQFEQWKVTELEGYKKKADAAAEFTSKLMLQRWIIENEARIRKDAANRSVRNVLGKVTEHLIPFSEAFSQFNPKDARFIGSPIDLIVFDGAEEKNDLITIYFIEVKTGTSALSQRQRKVMEAVKSKRVEWLRLSIKDFGEGVNDLLLPAP